MPKANTKALQTARAPSKRVAAIKDKAKRTGTLSPSEAEEIRAANAAEDARSLGADEATGELAISDPAFQAVVFKVKKRVTVPVLRFGAGTSIVCQITEKIHQSEVEDSDMDPANVAQIKSPSGEYRVLIVGEVLRSELDRAYPKDGYVNLWFHITKLPAREGKRYADYAISEIDDPTVQL